MGEGSELAKYLGEWPSREEAEEAVATLRTLSPYGIAFLARLMKREVDTGRPVTIAPNAGHSTPLSEELVRARLVEFGGPRDLGRLTLFGRRVGRALPIGSRSSDEPDWWREVTAPLRTPPNAT
jgi:hypothetical protein